GFATCIELVSKFLRDPRELWPLIKDLKKLGCSETFLKETNADLRNGDFDRVNRHWNQVGQKIGWSRFDFLELFALIRATQTAARCVLWHRTSPLGLIESARRGDRRAVLDLVKIDKLFLVDACTRDVLRAAAMAHDRM